MTLKMSEIIHFKLDQALWEMYVWSEFEFCLKSLKNDHMYNQITDFFQVSYPVTWKLSQGHHVKVDWDLHMDLWREYVKKLNLKSVIPLFQVFEGLSHVQVETDRHKKTHMDTPRSYVPCATRWDIYLC